MIIKINETDYLNTDMIVEMHWENRFYFNGSENTLVVSLLDNSRRKYTHSAWCDAYAIERKIKDAMK